MTGSQDKQSFWQLASIFGAGFGLSSMVVGRQLIEKSGAGSAFLSVIIGQIILWIISLGIISMAHRKIHTIKIVKIYMGEFSGILVSIVLISAFLIWYAIQLQGISIVMASFSPGIDLWQIGIPLGLLVAFLSMKGIELIKKICVVSLPFLICFAVYTMVISNEVISFKGSWTFSVSGVMAVVLTSLPGAVNLPTFFRHSRSKEDSVIGLALMMLFHVFFQIFTIFTGFDDPVQFIPENMTYNHSLIYVAFSALFVFIGFICVNLINIYFASVAWETITNRFQNSREYVIIGFLGTLIFSFFAFSKSYTSVSESLKFIQIAATSFIANLCVVLLISFIVTFIIKHRPRPLEKLLTSLWWFIGCACSAVVQIHMPLNPTAPILPGIYAILIAFLVTFFIEESVWALKNVSLKCRE
ncbi:MAG: hypothetical protein K2Y01_07755 [Rhabdochlamydiaceae bacterium]|nr:hypothetical protein [Rhabdochlamydiaceae bacterium]